VRKLGKKEKIKNPHVFVATPAYDGKVHSEYAQSLAEASFTAPLYGIKVTQSVMGNGAFIEMARNIFVKIFLEDYPDCTHLFFIDSDLRFEARAFIGLARADLPICAGVYRRRQEPEDYPAKWTPHPELGGLWVEDNWLLHDRVPTGFLCIRRDIVEEMAKDAQQINLADQDGPVPWLFYTKITDDKRFMGEDFAFSDDYVARYKDPIPVWTDFDFTHAGYKCNYHQWLLKQVEKVEQEKKKADEKSAA